MRSQEATIRFGEALIPNATEAEAPFGGVLTGGAFKTTRASDDGARRLNSPSTSRGKLFIDCFNEFTQPNGLGDRWASSEFSGRIPLHDHR
jgi:hypothetical protein